MCMGCKCGKPNDDHGNPWNITYLKLVKSKIAGDVPSVMATLQNMCDTYSAMCAAGTTDVSYGDDDNNSSPSSATPPTADKGDGPGTIPNDPNYLRNTMQYVKQPS